MRETAFVPVEGDDVPARWSLARRIGFRLAFCYLVIFCVDLVADTLVMCEFLARPAATRFPIPFAAIWWSHVVPWVGKHLLHVNVRLTFNGTDALYDWVLVMTELLLAVLGAALWSALDRRRTNYRVLYAWLRVIVRLMLAAEMLSYGLDKVIPMQFRLMTLTRLATPFGEQTPFGLLWNFMAASKLYTIFAGAVEVTGGLLLLVPELTTLGALICTAAMVNVFVLNLAYDVPVKIRSFHLLLLSVFLLLPDVPRLVDVFVLHRRTEPVREVTLSESAAVCRAARWVPAAIGLVLLCWLGVFSWKFHAAEVAKAAEHSEFYGIWVFDQMKTADAARPLLTGKILQSFPAEDRQRMAWKRVILDTSDAAVIEMGDGVFDYVDVKPGAEKGSMVITDSEDALWRCDLKLSRPSPQTMEMEGTVNGNAITAKLHRERDFPLTTHSMRWVQGSMGQ